MIHAIKISSRKSVLVKCCSHYFHMSGSGSHVDSSDLVSQWSGGNPGFLTPAGRMLVLPWIHTHSLTHTHVDKEGDLGSRIMWCVVFVLFFHW